MALSTIAAIRDRAHALVEALTPFSLTGDRFRRYRNEGDGDLVAWAEANPAACLRRFQIRQTGLDELPHTSSVLEERVRLQLTARIAYPQSHRFGGDNALDRDDVLNEDWLKLNGALGIYGAANFTSVYDCIPLGATMEREEGEGVDFMIVEIELEVLRSTSEVDALVDVVQDGSRIYTPATAAQWADVLDVAGIVSGGPSSLWLCQEGGGVNRADSIGSVTITNGGATTGPNAVTGWTRTSDNTADGGAAGWMVAAGADPTASSCLLLAYLRLTATPGAERQILGVGGGVSHRYASVTAGRFIKAAGLAGASATGTQDMGTTVHPVLLKIDRAAAAFKIYTDQEVVAPAYTAPAGGTALTVLGDASIGLGAGPAGYLYAAMWTGSAAEISDAQIRTLLQTLGFTVAW